MLSQSGHGSRGDASIRWPTWAISLKPRIVERQDAMYEDFAHWMQKKSLAVWEGQLGFELNPTEHQSLREQLRKKAHNVTAELVLLDWWDRLIVAGNQTGRWTIPLLPPVVRLPPTRPVFVRRDFQLLPSFRVLESALLTRLMEALSPDQLFDAVLCSAIINGGVVSKPMLVAIRSMKPDSISGNGGELRVTLPLFRGKDDRQHQHWYPDAITSVVLTRLLRKTNGRSVTINEITPEQLPKSVERAFESLDLPVIDVNDLLRATHVAYSFSVPAYIAAYLADDLPSQSLSDVVLRRLSGWRYGETDENIQAEQSLSGNIRFSGLIEPAIEYNPKARQVDQLKFIAAIRKHLTSRDSPIDAIRKEISQHSAGIWPITRLLAEWTMWHLGGHENSHAIPSRKRIELSSARRYLGTIARHLIAIGGTENPLEMEADDFESLYELAAARVTHRKERPVFWARVRAFHTYLTLAGAPAIAFSELDGYESASVGNVSANLVSETDFAAFRTAIMQSAEHGPDTPRAHVLLAAILGFRCGLRRRETQMLRLHDIHPGPDPCLIIRSSAFAKLKSHSAHRRIPLRHLLPANELTLLLDYVERRKSALTGKPGFVFSHPGTPDIPLSDAELFDPITESFQAIIGLQAPRFRFHHLRHSFANWLFLALVFADNSKLMIPKSRLLACSSFSSDRISALREAFYPRLLGTDPAPTRKNLYLVSALLGHLSPQTTARGYLHLFDWLAGRESDHALISRYPSLGSRELGAICGLSPSMPHKPPYRPFLKRPVAFFRCFVKQQLPRIHQEVVENKQRDIDLGSILAKIGKTPLPTPSTLMLLLARRMKGINLETLERAYSLPGNVIELTEHHYKRMYAKQSVNTPKKKIRLPEPPRTREDAIEFWRILDATVAAFDNKALRPALVSTATILIRRNGPKTGRLYFGEEQEKVLDVVKGLRAMGIPTSAMVLEVRVSEKSQQPRPYIDQLAAELAAQNVCVSRIPLDWEKRDAKGSILRLIVRNELAEKPGTTTKRMVGRINGLNYSAMWIMFVDGLALSNRRHP